MQQYRTTSAPLLTLYTSQPAATVTAPLARKRTALADHSNKVHVGKQGGGNINDKKQVASTAASTQLSTAGKPVAASRPRTRSSIGKNADGDMIMDENTNTANVATSDNKRPIKSLRASVVVAAATAASSSVNVRSNVLAGRPTNIPRQSTSNVGIVGSSKNAGLKQSVKVAAAALTVTETTTASTSGPVLRRRTSKNAGLARAAAKRELAEVDDGQTTSTASNGDWVDQGDEGGAVSRVERRRSKRLRASDPEDPLVSDVKSKTATAIATTSQAKIEQDEDEDDYVDEDLPKDYGWEDLDLGDEEDPLMVSEYVREIHDYMKDLEVRQQTYDASRSHG